MKDATPLAHERNSIVKCKQIQPIIHEEQKRHSNKEVWIYV